MIAETAKEAKQPSLFEKNKNISMISVSNLKGWGSTSFKIDFGYKPF